MLNLTAFRKEIEQELLENILPFWMEKTIDAQNGGFYGRISNHMQVYSQAPKGAILNSRILWTFSAAYRIWKDERYLAVAERAFEYLIKYFWDEEYDGLYLGVSYKGRALESRKLVYNQAFGIYGFSEYYRATGNADALQRAIRLYRVIEKHCREPRNQGYVESRSRDWRLDGEMQMDSFKAAAPQTMNTHLHLMEAYTNLLRVWENEELHGDLSELIAVFRNHIFNPETGHFKYLFDEGWNPKVDTVSFGHDIEGSWLMCEAVTALGDTAVFNRVRDVAVTLAQKVYEEGMDPQFGGVFYEREKSRYRRKKIWWTQSEAMVGFLNAYELTGKEYFLEAAEGIWRFIKRHMVDGTYGEWFGQTSRDGRPKERPPKVSPWKCPYHNGRACMEILTRIDDPGL